MNSMHFSSMFSPGVQVAALAAAALLNVAVTVPVRGQSDLATSFLERAAAAERSGDFVSAENCYELALRAKPGDATITARLADLQKKFPPPDLLTLPIGLMTQNGGTLDGLLSQIVERVKRKSNGRLELQFSFADPAGSLRKSAPPVVTLNDNTSLKDVLNAVTGVLGCAWELNGATVTMKSREAVAARPASTGPAPSSAPKTGQSPPSPTKDTAAQVPLTASDAGVTVSYQGPGENPAVINDGVAPTTPGTGGIGFSWKPHIGKQEWVEFRFPTPRSIAGCEVFWAVSDSENPTPAKRVRLPDYWKVLYENDAGEWWPVEGTAGTPTSDGWNTCRFSPVKTAGLRLMVQIGSTGSAGLHEWRIVPGPSVVIPLARPTDFRLDDAIPVSAVVGFSSFRANKYSVTEEKRGSRVLLNGQPCERFLYTHASSSVTFAVPAGFTRFTATGIAPTQIGKPSWTYKVLGDGAAIFESKLLGDYPGNQVSIDVDLPPGCRTLTLVTDSAGNGNADHSIWAEPVLKRDPAAPLTWTSVDGKSLVAAFVRVEGDSVVVSKEGKELKIPLARLNADSAKQAKAFGSAVVVSAKPPPAVETNERAAKPEPTPPTAPIPGEDKLSSMAKLRKLAEKLIAINPNGLKLLVERRVLAQTSLPLPPGTFDIAEINIGGAGAAGFGDADFELLGAGRSATSVTIMGSAVTRLEALRPHRGLVSLWLDGSNVDDEALASLESARELTTLLLNGCPITGTGIRHLQNCGKLRTLALSNCPLGDEGWPAILGLRSLESLWIGSTKISPGSLKGLVALPKLRELNFESLAFENEALDFLPSLKSLAVLIMNRASFSRASFTKVAATAGLETLQLAGAKIDGATLADTDLTSLATASKLQWLVLSDTAVTGTGFASLGKCRALKNVELEGSTPLSDEGLAVLVGAVPGIERLLMAGNLSGKGFSELAKCRQLSALRIGGDAMEDVAVGALPTIRSLKTLELHGTKMGTQAAAAVARQPSLTSLNVARTAFDDAAIPYLIRIGTLKELSIGQCPFTAEGLEKIKRALPNCTVTR